MHTALCRNVASNKIELLRRKGEKNFSRHRRRKAIRLKACVNRIAVAVAVRTNQPTNQRTATNYD